MGDESGDLQREPLSVVVYGNKGFTKTLQIGTEDSFKDKATDKFLVSILY